MITIGTLMAGRFQTIDAYFWGLDIIDYPKNAIDLLILTNSDSYDFKTLVGSRLGKIKEQYHSVKFIETAVVPPSTNAFIDRGVHTQEHAETIATLYNELYKNIQTDDFLLLEDDIIAPSNAVKGLLECYLRFDDVGYACGTQMCRHNVGLFIWDLKKQRVYPEGDSNNSVTYAGVEVRKPWGVREIGLGHFGLTLLKRSICDKIPGKTFKPQTARCGALVGCDMVMCVELEELGYKKIANFDVRALHMDSVGRIH